MKTRTIEHQVLIAGGGPTGLMLAAELALAGVDAAIIEPRMTQTLAGSRASGLHARTLEIFDMRGIVDRFLATGHRVPAFMFNRDRVDLSDLPTRYACTLAIWQEPIERILAGWVEELGVRTYRGREVTSFSQDGGGVAVEVKRGDGSETMRAAYLVGCDGARSVVRRAAGIEFVGSDASVSWMIAEVMMAEEPAWGFRETPAGVHAIGKRDDGFVGIVIAEPIARKGDPSFADLRAALVEIYGTDFGVREPRWLSRFTDMARQAVTYRSGRILLAGDAAHIHAPMGGQGLNIGVQDAVNLGWKLARVVSGASDALLDSYTAERHPVGARVLQNTMAQSVLRRTDDHAKALSAMVSEFLKMDEPRHALAAEVSGLGVRYELGDGHPLLGRRMPDIELVVNGGRTTVFSLLRDAKWVLIDSGASGLDADRWSSRVSVVRARFSGAAELPVIGRVALPLAVLTRPDGYVAWVGEGTDHGLEETLAP